MIEKFVLHPQGLKEPVTVQLDDSTDEFMVDIPVVIKLSDLNTLVDEINRIANGGRY